MNFQHVFNYLAALGLGSILTIIIKAIFDRKAQDRKMLFEARTKAYAGITGRLFNLFQDPDIHQLTDPLKYPKLNQILSEVLLLGSHRLVLLITEYRETVVEFYEAFSSQNSEQLKELHSKLVKLTSLVHTQMRADLGIDRNTIFPKNPKSLKAIGEE